MRRFVGFIAAVVIVVAACSSAATVSPPTGPTPSTLATPPGPLPVSTSTAAPTPGPTPTPAPTPTPVAISDLAWGRVTTLNGVAPGGDIVGFAGGYVTLSEKGVFWSADGEAWTAVTIPSRVSDIASDGRAVLLVGSEERDCGPDPCAPDSTGCGGPVCKATPIAWRSTDGLTWERSKPWPIAAVDADAFMSLAATAWSVPTGGWDVVLSYLTGDSSQLVGVFHSDDGLSWVALPTDLPASIQGSGQEPFWGPGSADGAGRRLLAGWVFAGDSLLTGLFTSTDGRSWILLEEFPEPGLAVSDVVAPIAGGATLWLVAGTGAINPDDGSGRPTVWASPDLVDWSGQSLVMGEAVSGTLGVVEATGFGYVALGSLAATPESVPVATSWLSADGVDWIPLAVTTEPGVLGPAMVADGPAGVIGISQADESGDVPLPSIVWALR